jgi:hypothetical protein
MATLTEPLRPGSRRADLGCGPRESQRCRLERDCDADRRERPGRRLWRRRTSAPCSRPSQRRRSCRARRSRPRPRAATTPTHSIPRLRGNLTASPESPRSRHVLRAVEPERLGFDERPARPRVRAQHVADDEPVGAVRACSPSAALPAGDDEGRPGGDETPLAQHETRESREQSGFGVIGHAGSVSALMQLGAIPRSVHRAKGPDVGRRSAERMTAGAAIVSQALPRCQ